MIYIGHQNNAPFFLEIEEELNTTDNVVVYTWDDFINNNVAWLKLSAEQELFYSNHPDATPEEVYNMEIASKPVPDPEPVPEPDDALEVARRAKLAEIEEQDKFSEKFFVMVTQGGVEIANVELWANSALRTSLIGNTLPAVAADGETTTILWSNSTPSQPLEVPVEWAKKNLLVLELYAKRTYDLMQINKNAAYAATTVEEIAQIDVKANYPKFLTFELNLDLWNGSNNTETIN